MSNSEFTPLFLKYQKKSGLTDTPIDMKEYFRNKETPLDFIRDQNIMNLEDKANAIKSQIKRDKDTAFDLSKSNYRKVVRDNTQYKFGINLQAINDSEMFQEYHMHSDKQEDIQTRQRQLRKKQSLKKQYIHNYQDMVRQNLQSKQMNFDIIKEIDSDDFDENFDNVQFADIFSKYLPESEFEKFHNPYEDISDNGELQGIMENLQLNLVEKDSYYSDLSQVLLFDAENQIDFWKRNIVHSDVVNFGEIDEEQIMKRCQTLDIDDPAFTDFLDFAVEKISPGIVAQFVKIKKKKMAQMQLDENDQNLQEEYNQKKAEYEMLKEIKMKDKNKKIATKYVKNAAQTIDILEDKSFDSYFEEGCKDILIELKDVNQVRENIIKGKQPKQTQRTMLTNIGYQIKSILFRLLNLILVGENFPEYSELLAMDDKNVAQRKILELIYLHFDKIEVPEIDGIPKETLLNVYLQERQKNDRIFEILGRMNAPKKESSRRALTPTKPTNYRPKTQTNLKTTKKQTRPVYK